MLTHNLRQLSSLVSFFQYATALQRLRWKDVTQSNDIIFLNQLFLSNTSLIPLPVGLGDPSDLAPLIGGLLFLFGFTSQGGTTILPPSRTSLAHTNISITASKFTCAHTNTHNIGFFFFFFFFTLLEQVSVFTVVVAVSVPTSPVMIVIFHVYE